VALVAKTATKDRRPPDVRSGNPVEATQTRDALWAQKVKLFP
jgi:hypothetical protein